MPSSSDQAGREKRRRDSPLPRRGSPCTFGRTWGSEPRSRPIASGAIAAPQVPSQPLRHPPASRPFPRAHRARAPAEGAAKAPIAFPASLSLPSSLPWLGNIRDTALGKRPGCRHTAQARRCRAGEGSAKEEREAGEAKVAVRAGPRPESPPGGGGRGAA